MKFKVRYRKIVTTTRVEGDFECLVEAETAQRACVCVQHQDAGFGTIVPKTERKTGMVLGGDTGHTTYEVRNAEEFTPEGVK